MLQYLSIGPHKQTKMFGEHWNRLLFDSVHKEMNGWLMGLIEW